MNVKVRAAAILLVVAAALFAADITTFPDISGASTTVQVSAAVSYTGSCIWIQLQTPSTNASTVRVGDSATTSTRGLILPAGSGMYVPTRPINDQLTVQNQLHYLTNFYVWVATGDKLTVTCGL